MTGRLVAWACRLISGATVDWQCSPEAEGPRIYFGNHTSHLDFLVIWSALPPAVRQSARPVAGREYWEHGAVRRYLADRVFRAVLVARCPQGGHLDPVGQARASIEHMARELGPRGSLIVFPEGTRRSGGGVGPFRSGLYHLACARPDAELIPVRLENLGRMLPKGESLLVPMLSRVTFGGALRVGAGEAKQDFLGRARAALSRLPGTP